VTAEPKRRRDVRGLWKHGDGRRNTKVERTKGGTLIQSRHWLPSEVVKALRSEAIARGVDQKTIIADALTAFIGADKVAAFKA
jgi:hypothetical protein